MKKYNFYAGPSLLPREVYEEAAKGVLDFQNTGLSVLSISHRSKEFVAVIEEAQSLVKELLNLPDNYAVLFLQGGASSQFFMTAMNLLQPGDVGGYLDTGNWSEKAIKEAKLLGDINVVASSADKNFTYIPKGFDIPESLKFLHLTSNNTVRGTQIFDMPDTSVKLVADMSSDIFSRPIEIEKYGLIYAGAQKNMGPAGATLVIVDKDWVASTPKTVPSMLRYATHISKDSMFNTPPAFAVYVSMLTLRWVKAQGGVDSLNKINQKKAATLYNAIDDSSLFSGTAATEDRSLMNATFVLNRPELDDAFMAKCTEAGCIGVKGHRSVGGFRASIYNAMEQEGVDVLSQIIKDFDNQNA